MPEDYLFRRRQMAWAFWERQERLRAEAAAVAGEHQLGQAATEVAGEHRLQAREAAAVEAEEPQP